MGVNYKKILSGLGTEGFLPTGIDNLAIWLDSSDKSTLFQDDAKTTQVVSDADVVGAWADKSGNGNDIVQATAGYKPLYKVGLQNNRDVVRFDGADDYLKSVAFTLNQPETVYIVFKQITWTANDTIFDGDANYAMFATQRTASPQFNTYAGTYVGQNSDLAVGSYGIVRAVFNGASSSSRVNANAAITGDAGAGNAGGFTLGRVGDGGSAWSNIEVAEIIIYSATLLDASDVSIMKYLNDKWSIY